MKTNVPTIYDVSTLKYIFQNQREINGKWIPARPLKIYCDIFSDFILKIKCAYLVFRGKADVLIWPNQ